MLVIFLFSISLLFLALAFKHAQIGSPADLVYITLFVIFILCTFIVPEIYDCNKEITVKVIDKDITRRD